MTVTTSSESSAAAAEETIRPLPIEIPQEEIDDLRRRIDATRWPEKETVEDDSQGLGYVLTVILSFPYAMFVMAGAFGLWRAGIISNRFFSVGVAAVVVVLLGGTTWASDGFWAPDGAYSLVSQLVAFAWIAVISAFLYMRSPSAVKTPDRAAVPAA